MNDLSSKTVKELRDLAKDAGVTGRWHMNKAQLIEAITSVHSGLDDSMIEFENDCIIKDNILNQSEGSQKVTKSTKDYFDNAIPGTLIAFKRNSSKGTALSGKLVKCDDTGNAVIQTKLGTTFIVNPEDIVWVRTSKLWPKWVLAMFNGGIKEGESDNAVSEVKK